MRGDNFTDFRQSTGTDQAITATANSTDYLDQKAARDLGDGGGLQLVTTTSAAVAPTWEHEAVVPTITTNLIVLTAHALPVGTPVVFDTIATTTTLTAGTIYYVSYSNDTTANSFVLAPTLADALAGTNIETIDATGTANLTSLSTLEIQLLEAEDTAFTKGVEVVATSGPITYRAEREVTITNATDTVNLVGHGLSTGTPVKFSVTGSGVLPTTSPAGLVTSGRVFYAIQTGLDTFKIALTAQDAADNAPVNLTDDGTAEIFVRVADNKLAAGGPPVVVEIPPRPHNLGERYLCVRYVAAAGDLTAGSVRSKLHITGGAGSAPKHYPTGYVVKT